MTFPLEITFPINGYSQSITRTITLHSGLTVFIGPNGSGKTQLLRGLQSVMRHHSAGRKVRFISAGRIGTIENARSDFDGHRNGNPMYESARFGNKHDLERRHAIETLNGDFQTLSQRPDILIKIRERLKKLFRRDILVEWDAGALEVKFARFERGAKTYSSGREASGLLHLVGILTALYDDEVGVLLLDEPEVSLHPQLQAFLNREIRKAAGDPLDGPKRKIIVIATHSTEMLQITKPADLPSLVFSHDINVPPTQIDANARELQNKKIQALVARLGQEHKLALFAKRPLLVEGPSDVIICSAIASKIDMDLEAAGSQLLPVVGKGQMPVVAKLLRLLGKEPVVLADADAIADGLDLINEFLIRDADHAAGEMGFASARHMAHGIYNDFCNQVKSGWSEIQAYAEGHAYWINRGSADADLAKRRAAFCTLFILDAVELEKLGNGWVQMSRRLTALLDVLEKTGCFILRRGSIESYYNKSDQLTSTEKPTAAAVEMEYIEKLTTNNARAQYADITRCIAFAAEAECINEAESLRDIILSVAAPAFAKFQDGATVSDIELAAQSLAGDRAKLFTFEALDRAMSVSFATKVLDVPDQPLILRAGDDIFSKVNDALGLENKI
ncbi:ATP-dependent nuclease [Burkholderia cepacia]|uniref:ATP-dependent nuclease n=1 Tax=Burkholderia cepacia TaxID=292 RepID=UPI0009C09C91|nr:AAA family ATPase [Burkholderia cepacia]